MVKLECRCGAVTLRFASRSPNSTAQCCCSDCLKRVTAMNEGVGIPNAVLARTQPLNAKYLENRMKVEGGRDKIQFFRLGKSGACVNMCTTCCGTFLLQQHPAHNGKYVGTYLEACRVSDLDDIEPTIRFYPNAFAEEARAKLAPLPGWWIDGEGKPTGTGNYNEALGKVMVSLQKPIPAAADGEGFSDILESCGGKIEILA